MISTFILQPPINLDIVSLSLIAVLLVFTVIAVTRALRYKTRTNKVVAVVAVIIAVGGLGLYSYNPGPQSSVTVSPGALSVNAVGYFSTTVQASQVREAYVVNLGSWNVTLSSRTWGENVGELSVGFYRLSNGASADVLTDSQTNLVVVTTSGTYFILAPNDFQAFVAAFSSQVVPVANSAA
jgi:hypothetical protein